jgi:hypothetical protein
MFGLPAQHSQGGTQQAGRNNTNTYNRNSNSHNRRDTNCVDLSNAKLVNDASDAPVHVIGGHNIVTVNQNCTVIMLAPQPQPRLRARVFLGLRAPPQLAIEIE